MQILSANDNTDISLPIYYNIIKLQKAARKFLNRQKPKPVKKKSIFPFGNQEFKAISKDHQSFLSSENTIGDIYDTAKFKSSINRDNFIKSTKIIIPGKLMHQYFKDKSVYKGEYLTIENRDIINGFGNFKTPDSSAFHGIYVLFRRVC